MLLAVKPKPATPTKAALLAVACKLTHSRGVATPVSAIRARPNSTPVKFKPVLPGLPALTPTKASSWVPPTRSTSTAVGVVLPESTTDWLLFSIAKLPLRLKKPKACTSKVPAALSKRPWAPSSDRLRCVLALVLTLMGDVRVSSTGSSV